MFRPWAHGPKVDPRPGTFENEHCTPLSDSCLGHHLSSASSFDEKCLTSLDVSTSIMFLILVLGWHMPNNDVAIPIVFPDYLITVETPPIEVKVPDFLPGIDIFPDRVRIPPTKQRIPHLGHAGILFIDGGSGTTKYYEYGRYDPAARGLVRKHNISNVLIGKNGKPTKKSLETVLAEISVKAGQRGKIQGAYIELPTGAFEKMLDYTSRRMSQNGNPHRAPYELFSNSCLHFMKQTAEAGGAYMPVVIAPQPAGYIIEVRFHRNELDLDQGSVTIQNVQLN